jgi:alpha-glucosidase
MRFLVVFILLLSSPGLFAQKKIKLDSPNKQLSFSFQMGKEGPLYAVAFKNQHIINNSSVSLNFSEHQFTENLKIGKPLFRNGTEDYELIVGKVRSVHDPYNEVRIPLEETKAPLRKINFVARVFNDGIAFRYEFPQQPNWPQYSLTDEHTTFNLAGDPKILALLLPSYTTSHEGEYSHVLFSELKEDTLVDMPALFEFPGSIYMAITEAALVDYAGMYLAKEKNVLTSKLSPLPGQTKIKVKATLPHKTPWRRIDDQ